MSSESGAEKDGRMRERNLEGASPIAPQTIDETISNPGEVSTGSETCPMAIIIAGPNLLVKRLSQTAKRGSAKYLILLTLDCDKKGLSLPKA
jgi:hypothetical protein